MKTPTLPPLRSIAAVVTKAVPAPAPKASGHPHANLGKYLHAPKKGKC